jgi:hypothetical protein
VRLAAAVLALLLLAPPARAESPDPAALHAQVQDLEARTRAVAAEMRELATRIAAIAPDTPLLQRQALADRMLVLRRTLDDLRAELAGRRAEIAKLPDWYVLTVQGGGVSTMRFSANGFLVPELERLRGAVDVVVSVPPGTSATDRAAELQRALAPPRCRRGSVPVALASAPEFWEDLRVLVTAGPLGTRAEAEARRGTGEIATVEVVPYPHPQPNNLLRQFGCPEQPLPRVAVPDVRGLSPADAEARLKAQGLVPSVAGGAPAPAPALEFTVQETRPAAGTTVEAGAPVTVLVHSRPDQSPQVPDVTGLPADEAARRIAAAGLAAETADAGPAPSRAQAGVVARQGTAPGSRVARGAPVRVWVHGPYVPTPSEQVASAKCPANAQAAWNESAGRAECRCTAGFVAQGNACVIDRQAQVAGLRCPANAQATWNDSAGRAECRCTAGFVAQGNACVIDRQAAVATMQCPLLAQPYWDEASGRAACRCAPGYAFNGVVCLPDRNAAVAALACPPNAEGYWDEQALRAQCRCRTGFAWTGAACAVDQRAAVAGLRCPPNAQAYWDERAGRALCRCVSGFAPQGNACVVDRQAAVAALRCPPNADAYWDEGTSRAQCRCRQGYSWNGQACAVPVRTPPAPPPAPPTAAGGRACPPGQVWQSSGLLGQGDGICIPAGRR